MKRCFTTLGITALGIWAAVFALTSVSQATIVGFGQLGGNNTDIQSGFASNAAVDGNGFTVSNGATPNIALTWGPDWDVHGVIPQGWFNQLENHTIGGGDWDNDVDSAKIGQLDGGNHTIAFAADAGYALVLNSFDFGHTAETAGDTNWDLTLTDSSSNTVWSQSVEFVGGSVVTVAPNFTGGFGESYTLTFERVSETYGSNGRHGIDNLSFNQVAIPEPATLALVGLGALGVIATRGRRR